MQKRGLADVDWIIASGVFLVSLVTVLIFIKPGIIPLHSSDSLLDLIENNFKKDLLAEDGKLTGGVYWTVQQTPIFLTKDNIEGLNCIQIDFPYDISANKMRIYKDTGRKDEDAVPFEIGSGNLIFKADLNSEKNIYYIYSSNNELYKNVDIITDCTDDITIKKETENPDGSKTINFVYEYGVNENLKGIARPIVDLTIENIDSVLVYNALKNLYGYPKLKEFALLISNTASQDCSFDPQNGDTSVNCEFQPLNPGDVDVYARLWSDFILDYNGARYPVTIAIKVW